MREQGAVPRRLLPCCSQTALPATRCIAAPATDYCGFGAPCRRPPLPPVSSLPADRPSPAHGHGLPPPCGPAAGRHPGGGAGAGRVSVGRACPTASSWGSRQLDGDLPGPGKLPRTGSTAGPLRSRSQALLPLSPGPSAVWRMRTVGAGRSVLWQQHGHGRLAQRQAGRILRGCTAIHASSLLLPPATQGHALPMSTFDTFLP